jgi:hypothetical protein
MDTKFWNIQVLQYTRMKENLQGGHEWVIEFANTPNDKNKFVQDFDNELKKLNSDYEAKRNGNIVLATPKVHFVESGTFYKWMEKRWKDWRAK